MSCIERSTTAFPQPTPLAGSVAGIYRFDIVCTRYQDVSGVRGRYFNMPGMIYAVASPDSNHETAATIAYFGMDTRRYSEPCTRGYTTYQRGPYSHVFTLQVFSSLTVTATLRFSAHYSILLTWQMRQKAARRKTMEGRDFCSEKDDTTTQQVVLLPFLSQ